MLTLAVSMRAGLARLREHFQKEAALEAAFFVAGYWRRAVSVTVISRIAR